MITSDSPFYPQVRLLIRVLPYVAEERCFALKGGTAINLFVRDMPRLSVDIDLAYVPVSDRETALNEIDGALHRIKAMLEGGSPAYQARISKRESGRAYGLQVTDGVATIKIEVSPVLRGSVYAEETRRLVERAEVEFGFAEIQMLSLPDLYAGKVVAALDRQHPRDLFDVQLLLAAEGITDELFRAFLVYLLSHDGSMARIISPAPKKIDDLFERQFREMTAEPVTLRELHETREALIVALHRRMNAEACEFLLSFKRGEPKWDFIGVAHVPDLPAIRWKLFNLQRLDGGRRSKMVENLARVLSGLRKT